MCYWILHQTLAHFSANTGNQYRLAPLVLCLNKSISQSHLLRQYFTINKSSRQCLLPQSFLAVMEQNKYFFIFFVLTARSLPVHDVDDGRGKNLSRKILINCVCWNEID